MTTMVWVYLVYLAICILVTVLVARTLRAHGPIFMAGKNSGESALVEAKTHLMVVGFYLVTIGLVGVALRYGGDAVDTKSAIEILSTKIGAMVFVIGFMHFLMVAVFAKARARLGRRPFEAIVEPVSSHS